MTANAKMIEEFLDALRIKHVDLVGNDSGGGIAQIFAATHPERIRSLTLTDCDAHDNWPPEAFKPFLAMAAAGGLRGTLEAMLADKSIYRSEQALGPAYQHPERVSDDSIETYLRPLIRTEQRTRDLQRFLAAFDNRHTTAVEDRAEGARRSDVDCLGHRRCVLRREVVAVARRQHPRYAAAHRAPERQDLLPGRAMHGIQQGAARTLAVGAARSNNRRPLRRQVSLTLTCAPRFGLRRAWNHSILGYQ